MMRNNNTTKKLIYVGNRRVGSVKNGVFEKTIKENQYLKFPVRSIALDTQSLRDAEEAGASSVHVKDAKAGVTYKASIAQIWRAGTSFNRGWGDQIYLPVNSWILQGQPIQLDMFEGVGA